MNFHCHNIFIPYLCDEITTYCECLRTYMDTKEIGTIIKERRKHLGVNQQTLSDLAGIGLNTLAAVAYRRTTLYNKRYS